MHNPQFLAKFERFSVISSIMGTFSLEDRTSVDVTAPASAILAETFRETLDNHYQSYKLLGLCRPNSRYCFFGRLPPRRRKYSHCCEHCYDLDTNKTQRWYLQTDIYTNKTQRWYLQTTVMLQYNNRKANIYLVPCVLVPMKKLKGKFAP